MSVTGVLIVGVGGQGIVLAGDVIALAAQLAGMDVKANEVHGMSQRGGSVESEVRFGERVFSPLIPPPGAGFLLAFELLEGLRALPKLAPEGTAIINRQRIVPSSVTYGAAAYPTEIEERLQELCSKLVLVDAAGEATKLGNVRAVNTVLMGVLASRCEIPVKCWEEALRSTVKPRFIDLNLKAFSAGRRLGERGKEE
ncbi:MAG: indolepyruvate oxidoreductase subunit beta [Actinobacteria bacterium]|nr:MAG: indolepyruvate oxidoreductase subunit beta [Actinomycetota bacterium]